MTISDVLIAVQSSALAGAVRGDTGSGWLFPNIETIHVLSIAAVIGSVLMMDLRLLGWVGGDARVTRVARELLPVTWYAFAIALLSGLLLFISRALTYFHNLEFRLKFLFLALAGLNMLVFHLGIYRQVADWDEGGPPPWAARLAGALSVSLWVAVVFMGRWVGFDS